AAARRLEVHQARMREFLGEVEDRRNTEVAFGERRIELQQRALQQTGLRRYLSVGEDLQRPFDDRICLRERRQGQRSRWPAPLVRHCGGGGARRSAHAGQVLVRDELVTVPLQDDARERASTDDEDL